MKSEEAREFVRTMEKEYNAHNKMINSTVAHQAVRMAEIELTQKAISAFDAACSDCGQLCSCLDCSFRRDFIKNLNKKGVNMAFHAKKQGGDAFSKKVTRKDTKCFICNELIPKGSERYVSGYGNSLCDECYKTWMKEGGKLGKISRAKINV